MNMAVLAWSAGREAEFPFRNVSTLTGSEIRCGLILRGCIVRLRDVPGSRSSQRLCLCHCGATSPRPLKFPNVRLYGYLSLSCRRPFFRSGRGGRLRRAGHAAPHSRVGLLVGRHRSVQAQELGKRRRQAGGAAHVQQLGCWGAPRAAWPGE